MNYNYGYVRENTCSQELNRQLDMLEKYHCNEFLTEKISGTKSSCLALNKLKDVVCEEDTVIVESWSRLERNTRDFMDFFSKNRL
ncbi:recombinase family protein [Carnobacterium gallinarum]|uniref:recombinase family protein n=1 Tax=Carnobacterium gallinarum TaxID=2749 RepID=UPI00068B2EF7|nr:recombinase family protein [Carnobacterium gallinarum]